MEKGQPIDQTYPKMDHQHRENPPPYYPNLAHEQQHGGPPPVGFAPQSQGPLFAQPMSPAVVQMVQILNLGNSSQRIACPHCGADISTRTRHEPGRMTHIAALILCLLCWPLVCVPYCMDDCMDVEHSCPNCEKFIGSYKR